MKKKCLLIFLLLLLISYPPAYLLATQGVKALFGFFAEDAFYYLTVARNSVGGFFTTFDGERLTNGYHPLWQFLLIGLFKVIGREQVAQLYSTFFLGYALTLAGVIVACLAIHKATRSLIAPLWMVPGVFCLLFEVKRALQGIPYTYSVWSSMNGMESSLSVFFGGILLYLAMPARAACAADGQGASGPAMVESKTNLHYFALGCMLACCVFSRLDDIFLLPAFAGYILLSPACKEHRFARLLLTVLPASVILAVYMALNYKHVGTPMPVSGQMKGGLFLWNNLFVLLADFFPPLRNPGYVNLAGWEAMANRAYAMAVPVLLAIALLAILATLARRGERSAAALCASRRLTPLLIYVALKGLYNFVAVHLGSQGYWYWSLSIMTINFALIVFCAEIIRQYMQREGRAILAAVGATVWFFAYCHYSASVIYKVGTHNHWSYAFWQARDEIRKSLTAYDPKIRLIDGFDGIVGYALALPTISGTALATDVEGLKAAKRLDYLNYCLDRGYNVLGHFTQVDGYVNISDDGLIKKDVLTFAPAQIAFTHVVRR